MQEVCFRETLQVNLSSMRLVLWHLTLIIASVIICYSLMLALFVRVNTKIHSFVVAAICLWLCVCSMVNVIFIAKKVFQTKILTG